MTDINLSNTESPQLMQGGKTISEPPIDSGLIGRWIPAVKARFGETAADLSYKAVNLAAGTATIVNTLGGLVIAAAGQEIVWDLDIGDMDTERVSYIRVVFSHTSADVDAPIFKVRWSTNWLDDLNPLTAVTGAAITTTYTTQTFGAHTVAATANAVEVTLPAASSGIIPANSFPNTGRLLLGVEADSLGGAAASELAIQGIYMWYYRK